MNGEGVGANRVNDTDAITEQKAIPDNGLTTVAPAKVVFDPNAKGMAAFREAPSPSLEV